MRNSIMSVHVLVFIVVIGSVLVGAVILTHNSLTALYPGHNDFMSRWEGARSYWIDGLNPYGDEASLNIQERIYGRAVVEGEDPGFFAYPFFTVFLVLPIVFTSYAWASAIWMVLLEACLIAALFILLDLFQWKPAPWLLGLLVLWTLILYYAARGLILGQPGIIVYFLGILTIWALYRRLDVVAGLALALSTIKPQMGFLIVPFLLLWGLRVRRWRFLFSFGGVFGLLMIVSFLLQPTWLGDWLGQVQIYSSYTALGSPVWIITEHFLGLGPAGEWAVNLIFYTFMLWAWYQVLVQQHTERWLWVCTVTLVVTHLVAPRTATPHYVVFILPLIFYFAEWTRRDRKRGSLWVALTLVLLTVIPWVHFVATVDGEFEHPTVYLPLPFVIVALLWLTHRLWWQHSKSLETKTA